MDLPPLSLVDTLHASSGGFSILWFHCLYVAHLLWVVCPNVNPCPFISPFLGCLLFTKFGRVSSTIISFAAVETF